jgi:hypothetical protein
MHWHTWMSEGVNRAALFAVRKWLIRYLFVRKLLPTVLGGVVEIKFFTWTLKPPVVGSLRKFQREKWDFLSFVKLYRREIMSYLDPPLRCTNEQFIPESNIQYKLTSTKAKIESEVQYSSKTCTQQLKNLILETWHFWDRDSSCYVSRSYLYSLMFCVMT